MRPLPVDVDVANLIDGFQDEVPRKPEHFPFATAVLFELLLALGCGVVETGPSAPLRTGK